jgi:hypothetical protein
MLKFLPVVDNADRQSLINLGSDYFEFWHSLEVILFREESLLLFVDSSRFDYLRFDIESQIVLRLKEKCDGDLHFS